MMSGDFYMWLKSNANSPAWTIRKNAAGRITLALPEQRDHCGAESWEVALVSLSTTLNPSAIREVDRKLTLAVLADGKTSIVHGILDEKSFENPHTLLQAVKATVENIFTKVKVQLPQAELPTISMDASGRLVWSGQKSVRVVPFPSVLYEALGFSAEQRSQAEVGKS